MPSIFRHPRLILNALRHYNTFRLGWQEAHENGRTYDNDPYSNRSEAYDTGRDLRRHGTA